MIRAKSFYERIKITFAFFNVLQFCLMEKAKNNPGISSLEKTCFHCGEDCPSGNIKIENKSFCCEGCKMVFEILQEGDLDNYYELEQQPGISQKGKRSTEYDYFCFFTYCKRFKRQPST